MHMHKESDSIFYIKIIKGMSSMCFYDRIGQKVGIKIRHVPLITGGDLVSHSLVGLFISYVYFLIGLYVGYVDVELTFDLANKYSSCFDDICWGPVCRNVCVHLVIVWVVYIGELH